MRVKTKVTVEDITNNINRLNDVQQKLILAFYGIHQPKKTKISDLSELTGMNFFDTEKELITAINLLKK